MNIEDNINSSTDTAALTAKYNEREKWYLEVDKYDDYAYDYYSGWLCGYRAALLGVAIPDWSGSVEYTGMQHGFEAAIEGGPIPKGVVGVRLDLDDLDAWVTGRKAGPA